MALVLRFMNLGLPQLPEWLLKLFFYLALIGAGTIAAGVLWVLYVIVRHLHLVW